MKLPLAILAALAVAATLHAINPALLGVGFVPASEAQPALDTTSRAKVEDAWAYPITEEATLIPESATAVTRRAFLRHVDGIWQVVAIKATLTLKDKVNCDAFTKSIEDVLPRTLTETIGKRTRISFQANDEHAMLIVDPIDTNAAILTLFAWRSPLADGLLPIETPIIERDLIETMDEPSTVTGELKTFLGLPFGKVVTSTRKKLDKTSSKNLYTFTPTKNFLSFSIYFADTTENEEVYRVSAAMRIGEWDGRDEAIRQIFYVASYIEEKYNCGGTKRDLTDRFTRPCLRYSLKGSTIDVYATVDEENYDWTIWIAAEDDVLSEKERKARAKEQLDAL